MAALTAGLEVGAGEGAGLATAACAESGAEAGAIRKVGMAELTRAGIGLPGAFTAAIVVARAAAEVAAVLLVLRAGTLRIVLERLLDALCQVAKACGTEVLQGFFNVLAFFRGVTGALLRATTEVVVATGAGALLGSAMGPFIAPGCGRWSGWLIPTGARALREGGGGETEGGEKRDDAWCLHARVENPYCEMVAKFLSGPAGAGLAVTEARSK